MHHTRNVNIKTTFKKLCSCPQWLDQGMMLKAIVFLMARLGFGLTQSGCKLKRRVQTGPCLFLLLLLFSAKFLCAHYLICFYIHRLRGTWELKPCHTVDREESREYLVKYVLPSIKEKWHESDRWKTIYIEQDNARTHILADDAVFLQEAARGGWDIKMIYQPPNSPDTNILDLGWFASIQAMFHKKMPKTLVEIVQKVSTCILCIIRFPSYIYMY